jgi:hypothetical protein
LPIPSKLRSFVVLAMLLVPMTGSFSGCSQPDNPKMAEAPPPAPATEEEKALPKDGQGKARDLGALPKYKRAFNKNQ